MILIKYKTQKCVNLSRQEHNNQYSTYTNGGFYSFKYINSCLTIPAFGLFIDYPWTVRKSDSPVPSAHWFLVVAINVFCIIMASRTHLTYKWKFLLYSNPNKSSVILKTSIRLSMFYRNVTWPAKLPQRFVFSSRLQLDWSVCGLLLCYNKPTKSFSMGALQPPELILKFSNLMLFCLSELTTSASHPSMIWPIFSLHWYGLALGISHGSRDRNL